jgi:hypothetical protein
MSNEFMYYAIHSKKQAMVTGELEYSTPDGGTVIVTEVSDLPGAPESVWDDKESRGMAVKYIRRVSEPAFPFVRIRYWR